MKLSELIANKSREWREGFFAAMNLNRQTKAVFLGILIGEPVELRELPEPQDRKPESADVMCEYPGCRDKADFVIQGKVLCYPHRELWKDEGYDQPGLPPSATT